MICAWNWRVPNSRSKPSCSSSKSRPISPSQRWPRLPLCMTLCTPIRPNSPRTSLQCWRRRITWRWIWRICTPSVWMRSSVSDWRRSTRTPSWSCRSNIRPKWRVWGRNSRRADYSTNVCRGSYTSPSNRRHRKWSHLKWARPKHIDWITSRRHPSGTKIDPHRSSNN